MKVGILTYHNAINYGAVLQAYAMQNYLKDNENVDAVIIDYKSRAVENQYKLAGYREKDSLKAFIYSNFVAILRNKKRRNFLKFQNDNIIITQNVKYLNDEALRDLNSVIVGSDQVWNPDCTKGDITYLLNDLSENVDRISYAASMGGCGKINDFETSYGFDYIAALKKFKAISLRESDAAEFLTDKSGKKCETVIDPVLLYGETKWNKFLEKRNYKKDYGDYIFVYNLGNYPALKKLVSALEKETGYKVIVVNKDIKGDILFRKYKNKSSVAPDEFLHLLTNAKIVLSDSFHATAFSILFRKNFYVVGNYRKDNTNSRMLNILKRYGLDDRYVVDDKYFENQKKDIDFSVAEAALLREREFSKQWIKMSLK